MRKKGTTLLLVLTFLIGLSLLLYPSISNWWNSVHQTRVIMDYAHAVEELSNDQYDDLLTEAQAYNRQLLSKEDRYDESDAERKAYMQLLNVTGNGAMGYVEIPKIHITLPIYHTTETDVLQFAAGHLPGSSLPIGGIGTHSVLSGHRGLPSAKLFTDIDKLQVGDVFHIRVLKHTLTYEVDQILIVDPENLEALEIDPDADRLTLLTCTPYGVNTHRLLVRGHRVENEEDPTAAYFTSEAIQLEPVVVAPFVSIPLLLLLLIILIVGGKKRSDSVKPTGKEHGYDKTV